jgi:hypothetical protein
MRSDFQAESPTNTLPSAEAPGIVVDGINTVSQVVFTLAVRCVTTLPFSVGYYIESGLEESGVSRSERTGSANTTKYV